MPYNPKKKEGIEFVSMLESPDQNKGFESRCDVREPEIKKEGFESRRKAKEPE